MLLLQTGSSGGSDVNVTGNLTTANGCFSLNADGTTYPVAWPEGTRRGTDAERSLTLPDGTTLREGDRFEGSGGYETPPWDGAYQRPPRKCLPPTKELIVIDSTD